MNIRSLTPLAEKARVELNEDLNRVKDDLKHIRDWIAKQPHLRARTDGQWLLMFLRGCKFSLEKTKEKIDLYYSVRTAAPGLFAIKYTDPIFDVILNDGGFIALPKTITPDSPRVVLARMKRIDISKYSLIDVMGAMEFLEKIAFMEDDHLTVAGRIMVMDCEGVSMSHFTQLSPSILKKIAVVGQVRVHRLCNFSFFLTDQERGDFHVVNPPIGVETVFNLLKSFIIEKNRDRFHIHSTLEELFKYIPKDILPAEYGGNGGNTEDIIDIWKGKMKAYKTFLDEEENFGTDEQKRPGKPRTSENMFGLDGSFR